MLETNRNNTYFCKQSNPKPHSTMKKARLVPIALMLAAQLAAQPLQRIAPELADMDPRRLENADNAIRKAIEDKEIPGAVLAVVRGDKLAYLKAYGNKQVYPETLPMDVNTVFDLASVSKSVSTAISACILIERGQLRLPDAVKDFIPGFRGWKGEDGRHTDIRVADIMTHTSGLPPYAPVDSLAALCDTPDPDKLIDYITTCRRDFRPKTGFQYSCLNYITLQRIIEVVSGQSLRDFAKENIFDILGMTHTDYQPAGETLERVAPTEKQTDGSVLKGVVHDPLARVMNGGISGNAGLFSDANDLAILAAALMNSGEYNGKRILSPLGVMMMTTVTRDMAEWGRSPGWDVFSPYASNNGDLFGPGTYGHTGYTGTSLIINPGSGTAVILLTNRVHPEDNGAIVRLRSLVANAVAASIDCQPARVYYPHYYKRVEEFKNEPAIAPKDIVMLGNSLTEGGDWKKLTGKKNLVNRGIAGDEIMGIYDRLHQILPGKPKKIFLLTGTNDVSHDLPTDTIVGRMALLIDKIQAGAPKTKLYLQSLLPINESFGRYKRLDGKTNQIPEINTRLEKLAKEKGITYIDLFPLFTEPGTNVMRPSLTNDGLHLKNEGYELWAKELKRYL